MSWENDEAISFFVCRRSNSNVRGIAAIGECDDRSFAWPPFVDQKIAWPLNSIQPLDVVMGGNGNPVVVFTSSLVSGWF